MAIKSISLEIDTFEGTRNVELMLTRRAVITAERKGILNLKQAETAPMAYYYGLTHAAVLHQLPGIKSEKVDDALDKYFDNGGTIEALGEVLTGQYTKLFSIAEVNGGNQEISY